MADQKYTPKGITPLPEKLKRLWCRLFHLRVMVNYASGRKEWLCWTCNGEELSKILGGK